MKRIVRFFLLAVVGLSFLGLSFAQNWSDPNPEYLISGADRCMCGTPFGELFSMFFLIIIGLFLVILSLCSITLYKKHKDKLKNPIILCIPILNLYQLFKITIGRIRFYCLIIFLGFFGYLIYSNRDGCCHFPHGLTYPVIAIGFVSICVLIVFLVKLIIISKKSNKESHNE